MCERWVGDWTKTATYWPPSSSVFSSPSFSFWWTAQPGALRAQLSAGSGSHCLEQQQPTPNCKLQTNRPSCRTGLYHCMSSTCFLWASNSTRPQSRLSPDIFNRMHLLFTQVHFLFDSSAGSEINMLHGELNCDLLFSEFNLESRHYSHLWINSHEKSMKPLSFAVIDRIVLLLFFKGLITL